MSNVLITGVSGLLGTSIVNLYKKSNDNVIGVSRDLLSERDIEHLGLKDITWCRGSITDYNFIQRVITDYEIDYVYHLAAQSIVRICEKNPVDAFNSNVMGTVNVLESCRHAKTIKGIICISSDKYYGQLEKLPYTEDMKPSPKGVYEVSKTCTDLIGQSYGRNFDLPLIIVRACNLFVPRDLNLSRLVPGSIVRILNNESPVIYEDVKDYVREFIYIDDAADILFDLMQAAYQYKGEAVNVGSGYYTVVSDLIYNLIELLDSNVEIKFPKKDNPFFEIDKQYLDLAKLHSMIGNKELMTNTYFNGCLLNTIIWYREYRNE